MLDTPLTVSLLTHLGQIVIRFCLIIPHVISLSLIFSASPWQSHSGVALRGMLRTSEHSVCRGQ